MIEYDGRSWLPILFRMCGSVIPRLVPRVVVATALGVIAVLLLESRNFKIPSVAHALVGVALGLLLVFRTNAARDRGSGRRAGRDRRRCDAYLRAARRRWDDREVPAAVQSRTGS
jgi:putative membrane protein